MKINLLTIVSISMILVIIISCKKDDDKFSGEACFTYSPATEINAGDVINFLNCSVSATYYLWNFGDGTFSTKSPRFILTQVREATG